MLDIILHLDVHIAQWSQLYGSYMYLILFLVIFAETGLVVTPFLPGDSLLFAVGALCATPGSNLDVTFVFFLLICAAVLGDNVNYTIGSWLGPKVFSKEDSLIFNKNYLLKTQNFYQSHGAKTVLFARFLPIIRTFAPFVAGIAKMKRSKFFMYSVSGSVLWMGLFLGAGFQFGRIPVVQKNFTLVIMAVIVLSFAPLAFSWLKSFSAKYTVRQ